jgi:hypothetical protein
VVAGVAAILGAFVAVFAVIMAVSLRGFGNFEIGPRATDEELAAAATTVPLSPGDCAVLGRLPATSRAVAEGNFDTALAQRDFESYRTRLVLLLTAFDADLRAAVSVAQGPMRDHIAKTRTPVQGGLRDLETARQASDYEAFLFAMNGWNELSIAEELLGSTCGGVLVADAGAALSHLTPTTSTTSVPER